MVHPSEFSTSLLWHLVTIFLEDRRKVVSGTLINVYRKKLRKLKKVNRKLFCEEFVYTLVMPSPILLHELLNFYHGLN